MKNKNENPISKSNTLRHSEQKMDSLLPLVFHELLMGKEPWTVIHERAESVDAPNRQVAELGKRWTDVAAGWIIPGQKCACPSC
jgi:hypothetical protein